jgi:hypothetical protein
VQLLTVMVEEAFPVIVVQVIFFAAAQAGLFSATREAPESGMLNAAANSNARRMWFLSS